MAEYIDEDDCKMHDECGVFGCIATGKWPTELDIANIISLGLVGLQHRGQESAGIVTSASKGNFKTHKGMGLVNSVFNPHILTQLSGNIGIGHTRYSTHGSSDLSHCQPFVVDTQHGRIAIAHNGELVNKASLRRDTLNRGVGLSTGSDSELITQLLCLPLDEGECTGPDWKGRLQSLMKHTPSAYSLVLLHGDEIYAAKDPYGNRPLCIGKLITKNLTENGEDLVEGWVVSSESCVFQSMGAVLIREVNPGEVIRLDNNGIKSLLTVPRPDGQPSAFCIFEYVYFARPDSIIENQMVHGVRMRCGMQLAIEAPVVADLISTVPESATPAAFGFSRASGIPYDEVLAKNRYIGRTFIQPSTRLRKLAVSKKFGVLKENVVDKKIVIVDDSIVRGNTMSSIIKILREGGALEVHVRIASPPVKNPCYMGINIPTKTELIANKMNLEETRHFLGADSLEYLSVSGLLKSVQTGGKSKLSIKDDIDEINNSSGHCVGCLTGKYPVSLDW